MNHDLEFQKTNQCDLACAEISVPQYNLCSNLCVKQTNQIQFYTYSKFLNFALLG